MLNLRIALRHAPLSFALALAALAGCRTTPEAPPPPQTTPRAEAPKPAAPAPLDLAVVYFDFDSAVLRPDAKATLKKNGEVIRGAAGTEMITLEGHCDERGSEEYNLALGERRADAVRVYLVDLGIPRSRFDVVSFGEAKPAVVGHDESAWKWNRRVESH